MNFSENFRIALRALSANKLRSGLTMLGIIIGVGAVVALMAIGNGATASITAQVQGVGSNVVFVFPGTQDRGPNQSAVRAYMYYDDYESLAKSLRNITAIAPTVETNATITYGAKAITTQVTATTPQFGPVRIYEAEYGRFLTEKDRAQTSRVAVIGTQTARDLFGGINPLGRSVKINNVEFEIVGVLKSKGSSGFGNADEIVLVPLETGYEKLLGSAAINNGRRTVNAIYLSADSPEAVNNIMVQTERILRREHRLKLSDDLDFTVLSQNAFLDALTTITATLTAFLGFIGVISLVVGGIGVMNIMLVSVTERTREIGLRKAVGAKRRAILLQFLIETLVLSFIGGLLGIGLGWLISLLANLTGQVTTIVDLGTVAIAFFVTALVGIFAGLYPAWRASRLRPIEALRYE
ncbi:MAG TPA: ABC transporter permease [Anaerolineales bacterium]|nr:ABC transporter permease [Anaerolineales bacterium]